MTTTTAFGDGYQITETSAANPGDWPDWLTAAAELPETELNSVHVYASKGAAIIGAPAAFYIMTAGGRVVAEPGAWIVRDAGGELHRFSAAAYALMTGSA